MLEQQNLCPDPFAVREPQARALCGAVNVTSPFTGTDTIVREVEATADGDAAAVIPHGLGVAPAVDGIVLIPMAANFYTKAWRIGVVDATNVNLVATGAGGSGAAGVSVRAIIRRPHTIGR